MMKLSERDSLLRGAYWVTDAGACSGVYVLEEGKIIIDAGNMYGLVDELEELGPIGNLKSVYLTHSHFDHIGGLAEIFQYAEPDVYIHPIARGYLDLHRDPFPAFFRELEKYGKLKLVREGDVLEGLSGLKVLHVPGHTAGDIAFYDEASKSLFCGDAVLSYKLRFGAILSKPDEVCGGRMIDKLNTLKSLLKLPVRHLFPGHGEPIFEVGHDQIKIALATLYQSFYEDDQTKAWEEIGKALLEAGYEEEANQAFERARKVKATH